MTAPTRIIPEAPAATAATPPRSISAELLALVPGLLLCVGVTLAAIALARIEAALFGHAWLEALVLAILLGTALRSAWTPSARWRPGIAFGAKTLLEIAVVLLGASLSAATVLAVGPALLAGIALLVACALVAGYGIGRLLGLPPRMAILIASGNAICGNSAIAAVAPVIGAEARDVATSIAFTAVLGVVVVLGLPFLAPALGFSDTQYGVLAGMTVYAVPQVLAATAPIGATALQVGTLVKLVRVLMLGPVVLVLSLLAPRQRGPAEAGAAPRRPPLHRLVPWFILGFLATMALRSFGLLPQGLLAPIAMVAGLLTVISMAALGLGVDVRVVARAGGRVTATVSLSLLVLGAIGIGLIRLLGIA
ncbi:YeiH family protein [Plastoroseomonas hellenica]|uniref:YeiH family protein n=1 Tax=Plastoroseomonas hellenica TaxID=2687306 RepID=UPI001BA98330|nr:putative sulfate exporter family transporter [Plastoroseomonas hellenica]MBR0642984.1 putative sulfate exporter family transporter [Plastoroseomonas hellenica]